MNDISPALKAIMSRILRIPEPEINDQTAADHVEFWDSLGHLQLIMAIEDHFGISFPTSEIPSLTTYPLLKENIVRIMSK